MSEVMEYQLQSYCTCTEWDYENECDVLDEQGNPVPAKDCYGCWQDDQSNVEWSMLAPFLSANGIEETDKLFIGGDGLGWRRLSGYTIAEPNIEDIVLRLTRNIGDFTLYFKFDGKNLTVRRSSHDEPTGTGEMVFRLATEDEVYLWENR